MSTYTNGTYSGNETIVYNYLKRTLKYNTAVTCGIMANIFRESSFNPQASVIDINGKRSYGLFQWNDRYKNAIKMENWCKKNNFDSKTVMGQLKYFTYQLTTKEFPMPDTKNLITDYDKGIYNNRKGSIEFSGRFFSTFERGASEHRVDREKYAGIFWDHYAKGGAGGSPVESEAGVEAGKSYNPDESLSNTDLKETLDYSSLYFYDPYSNTVAKNLSKVKEKNYDYGYLIDLTHGGQFKFYVPEFTEQAGVNWSNIDIPGRSADILSYSSTNSRTISITLDLYAGVGVYEGEKNPVTKLHKDADFVKSLEYPDYSNPISRPPSTVQLILGSKVNMVGVIKDVTVEHRKPLDSKRRSMYLHITFTFVQTAINPPDYSDIRAGHYNLLTPNSTNISK